MPYEGETGIRALLDGLSAETGWDPILDRNNIIGLYDAGGGGAISLEPGGQFELSGRAARDDPRDRRRARRATSPQVKRVAEPLGIGFLTLGMSPKWSRAETPLMPKSPLRDHDALHAEGRRRAAST